MDVRLNKKEIEEAVRLYAETQTGLEVKKVSVYAKDTAWVTVVPAEVEDYSE